MAIDIIGSYRKWSLLTAPPIILGGIVSTVIVCDFLFRKTMILGSNLVLSASTNESKVFYLKMKGDYHRYMAEFKVGDERKEAAEDTMNSYKASQHSVSQFSTMRFFIHLKKLVVWRNRPEKFPMHNVLATHLSEGSQQELLDAIERERSIRTNPSRNTAIFHHPTLGDFELQHLPISATDTELEELIIQHLAAAAAMGRAHQIARKEGHRNRSSGQGRPHYLVFSTNSNEPSAPASSSPSQRGEGETPSITVGGPTSPLTMGEESGHPNTPPPSVQSVQASGSRVLAANQRGASSTYRW